MCYYNYQRVNNDLLCLYQLICISDKNEPNGINCRDQQQKIVQTCRNFNSMMVRAQNQSNLYLKYLYQFKIKLMEKDSQLSTMQAKMKKMQFRQTRQQKQSKIELDRQKDLLKQEKAKLDKVSKLAAQHQEQNGLLIARIADLKEDKQRQIQGLRSKYNKIKEEVRQYERILPTHTFLTELSTNIQQLPTYQQIFINLKDRTQLHQQTQQKLSAYRIETQEKLRNSTKLLQRSNQKREELQRNVKEVVTKNVDLETQMTVYRNKEEQNYRRLLEQVEEGTRLRYRVEELEEENKEYREKVDSVVHSFHVEIKAKEDQMTRTVQVELERFEKELTGLRNRNEQKENTLLNQLGILQEDVSMLQNKLHKDRQRYEEILSQLRGQFESAKRKEQDSKKTIKEMQSRNLEIVQQIKIMSKTLENDQIKISHQQEEISILRSQVTDYKTREQKLKQIYRQTINLLNEQKTSLKERVYQLQQDQLKATHQRQEKQNQIAMLLHQLQDFKGRQEYDGKKMSYDKIPAELEMIIRKGSQDYIRDFGSVDFDATSLMCIPTIEKKANTYAQTEIETLEADDRENIIEKVLQQQEIIKKFEENEKIFEETIQRFENDRKVYSAQFRQLSDKLAAVESQLTSANQKIKGLENNNRLLKRQLEQMGEETQSLRKKTMIYKEQCDKAIAIQQKLLEGETRDKQVKNSMHKQIREMKVTLQEAKTRTTELNSELKRLKDVKQKYEDIRKKNSQSQMLHLGEIQRLKKQIQRMGNQNASLNIKLSSNEEQITKKKEEIQEFREKVSKFQNQTLQKNQQLETQTRQVQRLKQLLQRQRKNKQMRVPSVKKMEYLDTQQEQEKFIKHYTQAGEKEVQKYLLQRQVSDLKEQIESLKNKHSVQVQSMQTEQNDYIQEIIRMKLKCAQADLRASEKQYLYCQMKKRVQNLTKDQF